jgi:hypothetical protein
MGKRFVTLISGTMEDRGCPPGGQRVATRFQCIRAISDGDHWRFAVVGLASIVLLCGLLASAVAKTEGCQWQPPRKEFSVRS